MMSMLPTETDTPPNNTVDRLSDPKSLENFLSILVHDIKAPIRHMRMHLNDIKEATSMVSGSCSSADETPDLETGLNNADKSLQRLKRISEKLGEYHISLLQPQPDLTPLKELILAEKHKLQDLIALKKAQIEVDALPSIMGDREQLGILFNNLLENALIYSGDHPPHIKISTEKINTPQHTALQRVVITDNGLGVPEDQLESIFKPFTRLHAKDEIEGAGLGLWIARTIAEKHYMQLFIERSSNDAAETGNISTRAILQWAL